MAQHVEKFAVLAPKNTPVISSVTTIRTFPPGYVTGITVKIPGGHSRKTGLQLFFGEIQLIPRTLGAYLRGNKVSLHFDFDDPFPGGSGWFTDVFNTGKYDHTFELFLEIDDVLPPSLFPPVLLLRRAGEVIPDDGSGAPGGYPTGTPGGGPVPTE